VNLLLFGLTAPFAAALMERFGMRRVVAVALCVVAAGSGLTVLMTASWQLVLCWGVLVGLGTGSMALVFAATVANRWFTRSRGLVTGILTAGSATGQLVFLPLVAVLAESSGWRTAALVVAGSALAVVPLVLLLLADRPSDVGLEPYGGPDPVPVTPAAGGAAANAVGALRRASRTPAFWLLAGGFAICGASTNGLIATHFVPARTTTAWAPPTAAGLLRLVGRLRRRRHHRLRAGSPTASTAGCCSPGTTRCAGSRCSPCRSCSPPCRTPRCCCSSSSTAWTGWRPCPRRSRCAASASAPTADRLRLGLRQPPGRRGDGGVRGRPRPHDDRQLRRRLARGGRAVPGRRRPVGVGARQPHRAASPAPPRRPCPTEVSRTAGPDDGSTARARPAEGAAVGLRARCRTAARSGGAASWRRRARCAGRPRRPAGR
jgi:hypothetical protein